MGEGLSIMCGWLWLAGVLLFGVVLVEISIFFSNLVESIKVCLISHVKKKIKIITILLNAIKNISLGSINIFGVVCTRPTLYLPLQISA